MSARQFLRPRAARIGRCAAVGVLALLAVFSAGATSAAAAPAQRHHAPTNVPARATFGIGPANAAETAGRGYFVYQTGAGGSYNDRVRIVNYGRTPLPLSVYAADITNAADGAVAVGQPAVSHDAGSWLRLAAPSVHVVLPAASARGPGTRTLPFSLAVPSSALPGDHAAALVAVLSTLGRNPAGENVRLNQRVAARVYIRVAGPLTPQLSVQHLSADYSGTSNPFGRGEATVHYTVANTGNIRLGATQSVSVSGSFGTGTPTVTPAPVKLLLPGGSYQVTVHIRGVFPTITQEVHVALTPMQSADETPIGLDRIRVSSSFLAVPWTLLALIALGLLLIIGGLWMIVRRRRRHGRPGSSRGAAPPKHSSDGPKTLVRGAASMVARSMIARSVAALAAATGLLLVTPASASAAAAVSDPYASGYLGFCDNHGHQIRSGSLGQAPFVWRAVASSTAPAGYDGKHGGRGTLAAYQPRKGVDPYDWSGKQMTDSSLYSGDHPMAAGTAYDPALVDFTAAYPPSWGGLVEVRMLITAPYRPARTRPYPATFIRVTGNTWTQVTGGSVDCGAGRAVSDEVLTGVLPSPGKNAPAPRATRGASGRPPGTSAGGRHGAGAGSGQATGSGTAAPSSGSTAPGQGSSSSPTGGGDPSPAAAEKSGRSSGALWWVVLVVAGAAAAGAVVFSRRRHGDAS